MLRSLRLPTRWAMAELAEVDGSEIEHDRLADEIARRARQRGVDLGEPFHDRHDGAEYERDIGTAAQPDQLTRGIRSDVHDVSTRLSY